MRTVLIILGFCMAAPAAAADQFDLVCAAQDVNVRYRIDLSKAQYCFATCTKIFPIHNVDETQITLYDENTDVPDGGEQYSKINRITGAWRWYSISPRTMAREQNIVGNCEARPFSGIVQTQKRF